MKPYKIALLTGTHQHRWPNDGSGICEKCHKEHFPHKYRPGNPGICTVCGAEGKCPHNGGFTSITSIDSTQHECRLCFALFPHSLVKVSMEKQCVKCSECGKVITSHQFSDGICSVCDYVCDHSALTPVDGTTHKCSICGYTANHVWMSISGSPTLCRKCNACGYQAVHQGVSKLGDACTVCGTVHSAHAWSFGTCSVCGTVCTHSSINSGGICSVCGMMIRKPGTPYCFFGGTVYDGSYGDAEVIYTRNDSQADAYTIYKGYKWSAASGTWVANGYYFFSFAVTHYKTMFGGDYAYKLTGGVFSTSSTTVNVSPALLSANGVYKLKLAQYETDGTLKASSMSGYTSADCSFNSAAAPTWPSWTP